MTSEPSLPFDASALSKEDRALLGQTLHRAGDLTNEAAKHITKAGEVMVSASRQANDKAEKTLRLLDELDQLDQASQARFGGSILNPEVRALIERGRQAAEQFTAIARMINVN